MGRTRGHPTDKECRDFIVAYIDCDEILQRTADALGKSWDTINKWKQAIVDVDGDLHDEYASVIEEKREQKQKIDEDARQKWLQETASKRKQLQNAYLELQLMKVQQIKDNPELLATVPFNQMSTAYGTVVDKDRLIAGDSTANTKADIKIELPTELRDVFGD